MAAPLGLLALLIVQAPPQDGVALLNRMHDAYAGKWFRTVTFVQQTIQSRNGVTDTTTWYEALKSPDRLRIDFGDPKNGNGVIYTADSVYVVRAGKVTRSDASGNPFLPFVAGVYTQPIDTTLRQIQVYKFDLSKLYTMTWEGRATYVAAVLDRPGAADHHADDRAVEPRCAGGCRRHPARGLQAGRRGMARGSG